MSSVHPSGAELQRFADGELDSVRAHVEGCAACSAEVSAMRDVLAECVQHRERILPVNFSPPPRPWRDLEFREQRAPWFTWHARGWAMAAALAVLALLLFVRLREAPPVQAAEILRRAVAAAKPGSAARRLQVRTRTQQFTRPVGPAGASKVKSVQAQFQAAHFDWDDPFTAKAFVAWREQLTDKRDDVIRERNFFRIRTDTSAGELMTATLTLRIDDLRPVTERLDFRNQDWVELLEAPADEVVAPPQSESVSTLPVPKPEIKTDAAAPSPTVTPAALGDELHAFVVIHRVGADLGDPIEVSRSGGEVRVTGAGISEQRQQQLRNGFASLPNVVLNFADPGTPKLVPRDRVTPNGGTNPDISQLQSRIAAQIGGREQFEDVASRILDLSDQTMARAYALRRLAEHFPAGSMSQLTSEDLQILNGLRADHLAAMRRSAAEMIRVLTPVLGTPPAIHAATPDIESLFQLARRVDRYTAIVFGNTPDDTSGAGLPAQYLSALADLRAALEAK